MGAKRTKRTSETGKSYERPQEEETDSERRRCCICVRAQSRQKQCTASRRHTERRAAKALPWTQEPIKIQKRDDVCIGLGRHLDRDRPLVGMVGRNQATTKSSTSCPVALLCSTAICTSSSFVMLILSPSSSMYFSRTKLAEL